MGLNLGFIGKKLQDIEGGISNFFGGVGHTIQGATQGVENEAQALPGQVNHFFQPQQQQPQQQQQPSPFSPLFQQGLNQVPGSNIVDTLGRTLINNRQNISDFGGQALHGLGDTAATAVGGLTELGGRLADPIFPGNQTLQAQQLSQNLRQAASDSVKAPNTPAGNAGYIAGSALGMGAQFIPAARGASLANDAASFLTRGATAPKVVQQAATKGLESIGGGLGYTAVSGDTSPQNAAQNIALGVGLEAIPSAVRAGATAVRPVSDATVSSLYRPAVTATGTLPERVAPTVQTTPEQIGLRTVQSPEEQSPLVAPKASTRSSSAKPTIKEAAIQPPDALAQALGLDHTPNSNAEPITMASVEKGIQNTKNLINSQRVSPEVADATQQAINRKLSAEQNPITRTYGPIEGGDYKAARTLPGAVADPLIARTNHAMRGVQKLDQGEKDNFWNMVENPSLAKSAAAKDAVARVKDLTDEVHARSQGFGGDTGYIKNYDIRNIDTENLASQRALAKLNGGREVAPEDFQGLDRLSRTIPTRAKAEELGIKFKNSGNPAADIREYGYTRAAQLHKQAIIRGLQEADVPEAAVNGATEPLKVGNGQNIWLSKAGMKQAKAFLPESGTNNLGAAYDRINHTIKGTTLSISQFHPNNISLLRAGPTLALKGHPVAAAKGVYGTYRAAFGREFADASIGQAIKDGMVDKAAELGVPYGATDFSFDGLHPAIGEKTVFGKQMVMMHDQFVRSIVSDLDKKNIPLDSPAARELGQVANNTMGFMNKDVQNLSPSVRKWMNRLLLAGQFTPSKFLIAKAAITKGGLAGSYARRAMVANVAATATVVAGIGYLMHQDSDDARDILLRALIDPAVPTPMKDNKGNTQKLRLPGTNSSDIAKILGITLVRGQDGHLGINWNPSKILSKDGTVADYARARLSPLAGAGVKVVTNSNYAGRPLYDPNAPLGTKVAQAATTLGVGSLPIGLQGLAYTDAVKNAVPGSIRDVLDAATPGSNPVLKSVGSSFGLTPSTDQTVGKGQQTAQYFNALDKAKQGLNQREQDAIDIITGGKKNPVTGKYEIDPTAYDTPTKANLLLQNPKVLQNLTSLNQKLASEGQNVDPFYKLSPDQQVKALQIDRLDPQNPDKTQNIKLAGQWYQDYQNARQGFFNSLPPGDPNKPQAPVQYVDPSASAQALQDKFFAITDPKEREQFIKDNPGIQAAFDATAKYDAQIRAARGDPALKGYPAASPALQAKLDHYNTLDKASRAAYGKANPDVYAYFQQVSQYSLEKDATQARYAGNDFTPKGVKAIQSLGSDIYYNGGITGSQGQTITPTGSTTSGAAAASSKYATSRAKSRVARANKISASRAARGVKQVARKVSFSHVSLPTGGQSRGRAYPKPVSDVYVKQARSSITSKGRPRVRLKKTAG